ncbi:MAG: HAMP domain-containing sensor histidine kinase [Candidatus Gracilibacteria bacterium]
MSRDIKIIKRDLAIMFSVIVFVVILFLGIIFFSAKYYNQTRIEKTDFNTLINLVETGKISINDIMNMGSKFGNEMLKRKKTGEPTIITPPDDSFKTRGFINYIYFDANNFLLSSNIKDEMEEGMINEVIDNDDFLNLNESSGFMIKKFIVKENNGTFIILKKVRYSFSDYINDVLGFLVINLLFAILLYIIGRKFVDRAFIPVEKNLRDMKDFIHNAGHELKTPLSVIDSNIQLIDDIKVYDKEMTKELKQEVIRLNSLIDSLVNLSDIDVFKNTEEVNLKNIIDEIINDFKLKISEKNIEVNISMIKSIKIKAHKDYLYIFLSNIIGNAIKYNKKDGKIDISYKVSELTIQDTGVGIDKKDLPKIFDRFYKADKSRNSEGFGIGLSLVKNIADLYKWKIGFESKDGEGTKVKIKFS